MSDHVHFSLPTLPAADMPRDDQMELVIAQATAMIVSAYLKNGASLANAHPSDHHANVEPYLVQKGEMPEFINSIQAALRAP